MDEWRMPNGSQMQSGFQFQVQSPTAFDAPVLSPDDEVIEAGPDFDFDGFQVVRREFFAHLNEPAITFNNNKVYVNVACLNRFPNVAFVQVLVNKDTKTIALEPCYETARDSFEWATKKRKPRQVTGKLFSMMIFSLMEWNPDNRYKILGKIIHANDKYLVAFDLNSPEVYERIYEEGQKPTVSKTAVYRSDWQGQFGLSYQEHKKSMQINIFDGYAVFSIKDKPQKQSAGEAAEAAGLPQVELMPAQIPMEVHSVV